MKEQKRRKNVQSDILENKEKSLRNKETNIISFVFVGLFFMMIGYLIYFNAVDAPKVINNSYNHRIDNQEKKVIRGDITASDGTVIATTQTDDEGNSTRVYPFDNLYCHVLGLSGEVKSGLESSENFYLLSGTDNVIEMLSNDISGEKAVGNTVVTTLVPKLQQAADKALGNNKGAVIAMEPSTGKVLAMVSKPDYNPNSASEKYEEWLTYDTADSVLLNRAAQGLYPPGSTFKIITALEYIREHPDYESYSYQCSGSSYVEGGTSIPCFNNTVHGHETLKKAFANSCNSAFSTMGLALNKGSFKDVCNTFLFNQDLPVGIEYSSSRFSLDETSGISEVQETSIGQGKTMVSPIHNLMIAASVANNGVMMSPYLVDRIQSASGGVVEQNQPEAVAQVMNMEESGVLKEYMRAVVTEGTGHSFKYAAYDVAGKTGSAQYDESENYHSWFVGFAPLDNPEIAICVILEGGYSGVQSAQVTAKDVLDEYFK
ncbi:MAG: penicillin-binding protein 2 [Eubacteriales bacterium]|nr:penicillin-binding protein 2 [Eubacteriales bacterium]